MYYKIINDRMVFSTGKTIQLNGCWISNPSSEQIAAAGWEVYVPPVIPAQPETEPGFGEVMEAVKRILSADTEELSDEDALAVAALYPTWVSKIGKAVAAGERLWYDGKLYKTLQPHTVQEDWTPEKTPALFAEVSIVEWPEYVQPTGAHDAYMIGDKMTFNGQHYTSIIDNNVYSPAAYPAGWRLEA